MQAMQAGDQINVPKPQATPQTAMMPPHSIWSQMLEQPLGKTPSASAGTGFIC